MKPLYPYLLSATLALAALTAGSPAYAEDQDRDQGVRQELNALKAQVAALARQNTALQTQVNTLQNQLAAVQANHALKLGPFVSVDPNPQLGVAGPNITFSGANIHIVSGSGATTDHGNPSGLGNLIIGYDELSTFASVTPGDRGGSHNLVIGRGQRFFRGSYGCIVAGQDNTIVTAAGASILAGTLNTADGTGTGILGGNRNQASGGWATISGGEFNHARGFSSSILGGEDNFAVGNWSSIVGGTSNSANGGWSSILGGTINKTNGTTSSVLGSGGVTANTDNSILPQPPFP